MAIAYGRTISKIFDCRECELDKRKKRIYGCVSPISNYTRRKYFNQKAMWYTDFCLECGGSSGDCRVCKGSNSIGVYRCARALSLGVNGILPFFYDWVRSDRLRWPNGRPRMEQPERLAQAFEFMHMIHLKYTENGSLTHGKESKDKS